MKTKDEQLREEKDFIILRASNYHYDLGIKHGKEEAIKLLNKFKGEVLSLPNRDDKLHCKILMPDGGGVDKFLITNKIEDLINLLK